MKKLVVITLLALTGCSSTQLPSKPSIPECKDVVAAHGGEVMMEFNDGGASLANHITRTLMTVVSPYVSRRLQPRIKQPNPGLCNVEGLPYEVHVVKIGEEPTPESRID